MGPLGQMERSTRRLFLFAILTLITVAVATAAVMGDAKRFAGAIEPTPMFPGLFAATDQATAFTIRSTDGDVRIVRNESGNWVVPARAGYPANPDLVRQTLVGLGELELIQAKTARDDWHHFLGLVSPDDGGDGIEIILTGANDESLAAVLIGNQPEGHAVEQDGRGRIHVRRPDEDQTWLARGSLTLRTDLSDWLASQLLEINRDRIAAVAVNLAGSDPYTISRESAADNDFTLQDLPVGREPLSRFIINGVATAITDLSADDVSPEDDQDFVGSDQVVYRTFDGLEITFRFSVPDENQQRWATIVARFTGLPNAGTDEAVVIAEEAHNINLLTVGWAFLLPDYQVRQMTLGRDSLLRPLPSEDDAQSLTP